MEKASSGNGSSAAVKGHSSILSRTKKINMLEYHDKMMQEMKYKIEQKKIRPYAFSPLEKATYATVRINPGMESALYISESTRDPYQGNIINLADYKKNLNNAYKKADNSGYKTDFEYKAA